MKAAVEGHAWVFGDNIDTDVIIPGPYLSIPGPAEMARHAFEPIDPEFARRVQAGDIVVGGRNFGCGSSREHAALVLKELGVGAVVVESCARIFFRNALNQGLPVLEAPGIARAVATGQRLRVDLAAGVVHNLDTDARVPVTPMPGFMRELLEAGGLVAYVQRSAAG